MINKLSLGLLTFGSNLDFSDVVSELMIFEDFLTVATAIPSLQPISRPCSIEIMYPREWRIAIRASLMHGQKYMNALAKAAKDFAGIWIT